MTRFNKDLKVKYNNQINQRFNLKILISLGITYLHNNKFQILLIKLKVRVLLIIKKVYQEMLGCPGGPEAKKYLHADYDKTPMRECEVTNDDK